MIARQKKVNGMWGEGEKQAGRPTTTAAEGGVRRFLAGFFAEKFFLSFRKKERWGICNRGFVKMRAGNEAGNNGENSLRFFERKKYDSHAPKYFGKRRGYVRCLN